MDLTDLTTFTKITEIIQHVAVSSAAIGGGIWAVYRFVLQRSHERQKPFLDRQMQHYFEATEITSQIATLNDNPQREDAIKRFWQLYWGPLAVVEDPSVEEAMVNFGKALRQSPISRATLQQSSLDLAHACRDCLERLWDTDLGQLKNLREQQKKDG